MRSRNSFVLGFLLLALWHSVASAAIARNSSADLGDNGGGSASLTVAYTVGSGANRFLVVATSDSGAGSTYTTGVTYAGVSMTQAVTLDGSPVGARAITLWFLANPASGSNNVVISLNQSNYVAALAADYTGAIQSSSSPDATGTNTGNPVSSLSASVTTVANNAWAAMIMHTGAVGTPTAGAGASLVVDNGSFGVPALFDSGAAITPAGAYSMTANYDSSTGIALAAGSFAPFPSGGGLLLRGVGP